MTSEPFIMSILDLYNTKFSYSILILPIEMLVDALTGVVTDNIYSTDRKVKLLRSTMKY